MAALPRSFFRRGTRSPVTPPAAADRLGSWGAKTWRCGRCLATVRSLCPTCDSREAVDRLRAVRPPRGLQGGAPHGTARGCQADRSAADARQLPAGALGQHPRSVQGGVRGARRIVASNPSAGKGAKAQKIGLERQARAAGPAACRMACRCGRAGRSRSPRRTQGARAKITVEGASLPPVPFVPRPGAGGRTRA